MTVTDFVLLPFFFDFVPLQVQAHVDSMSREIVIIGDKNRLHNGVITNYLVIFALNDYDSPSRHGLAHGASGKAGGLVAK